MSEESNRKDEERAWGAEIDRLREQLEYYRQEEEKVKLLHQQLTITVGTIGSIAFAGLVLVLQNSHSFVHTNNILLTPHQSFDALILTLAMTSVLALFSVVATSIAGSGIVSGMGSLGEFGFVSGLLSVFGMMLGILLLVEDFSSPASDVLTAFIVILCIILVIVFRRSSREEASFPLK